MTPKARHRAPITHGHMAIRPTTIYKNSSSCLVTGLYLSSFEGADHRYIIEKNHRHLNSRAMRGLATVPRMRARSIYYSLRAPHLRQPARQMTDYTSNVLYSRLDVRLQNVIIPDARDLLSILNIAYRRTPILSLFSSIIYSWYEASPSCTA